MNVLPSNLMMWKAYDPLCRYRGSSPLLPCSYAVDQLNEYARSNYSLLEKRYAAKRRVKYRTKS